MMMLQSNKKKTNTDTRLVTVSGLQNRKVVNKVRTIKFLINKSTLWPAS